MRLHYDVYGQGRPLVLVHGWGMNACVWEDLILRLQHRYRIYAVDLPGHGQSAWSAQKRLDLNFFVAQLAARMPSKALWMGWSLGALPCIQLALEYPTKVAGLVLLAATPRFVRHYNWPGMDPKVLARFQVALMEDAETCLQTFTILQLPNLAMASKRNRVTLVRLRRLLQKKPTARPEALQAGLDLLANTDVRNELSHLSCPSLVLLGEQDGLLPNKIAQALAKLLPNSQIQQIKGAAHIPQLSHPKEVAQKLNDFSEIIPWPR